MSGRKGVIVLILPVRERAQKIQVTVPVPHGESLAEIRTKLCTSLPLRVSESLVGIALVPSTRLL